MGILVARRGYTEKVTASQGQAGYDADSLSYFPVASHQHSE